MKSKILLIVLAAALLFSVSACGNNKADDATVTSASVTDATQIVSIQTEPAVSESTITEPTDTTTLNTTSSTSVTAPTSTTEATEPETLELKAMRALCSEEWHFVSGQTEAEELTTDYMDAVLSINTEKEATYTTIIKREDGPEISVDRDMSVIITDTALYDGCENTEWSAQLVSKEKGIEYYVTVLPDGTLKFMQFTYYDGEEYPFVFMADFVGNTYQ